MCMNGLNKALRTIWNGINQASCQSQDQLQQQRQGPDHFQLIQDQDQAFKKLTLSDLKSRCK
jgi:hypothetical protein